MPEPSMFRKPLLERVPTGISGLDSLIEGGIAKGSLVLVAGAPGTGKTSMCCKFLERGASVYNEKGLYVSFQSFFISTLISYLSHRMGPELHDLIQRGLIYTLAFPSMRREGADAAMESIMSTIKNAGVKRLVIDSITAASQSFANELEYRSFAHSILTKTIPVSGCTTLIIKETHPRAQIGESPEDFVADGVFLLRKLAYERRTLRELEIVKLRRTRIESPTTPFTLEEGFTVFPPYTHDALKYTGRLKVIPDSNEYFSTGNSSLDQILRGGYPKGSIVLLEAGRAVPLRAFGILSYPVVIGFLNRGCPLIGIQSLGADPARTYTRWKAMSGDNAAYGRSVEKMRPNVEDNRPFMAILKSEMPQENVKEYLRVGFRLRQQTGKPVLWWVALDHFVDIFGSEHAKKALSELSVHVTHFKELAVLLAKPGLEQIVETVSNIAATHLHIFERDGSILMYGEKPRTPLYAVTVEAEKGLSYAGFTPIV